MQTTDSIPERIADLAISGVAIGIGDFLSGDVHISTNYSPEWQDLYHRNGWMAADPVVRNGLGGPGVFRWALVAPFTEFEEAARDFGLREGVTVSSVIGGNRCIAGLTTNRKLDERNTALALALVRQHHLEQLVEKARTLSDAQRNLVYLFSMGLRAKEVAAEFGISVDAVKQRKQTIQGHIGVSNFLVVVNVCSRLEAEDHLINNARLI